MSQDLHRDRHMRAEPPLDRAYQALGDAGEVIKQLRAERDALREQLASVPEGDELFAAINTAFIALRAVVSDEYRPHSAPSADDGSENVTYHWGGGQKHDGPSEDCPAPDCGPVGDGEAKYPEIEGRCPACGRSSLFEGARGYTTCGNLNCPNPTALADENDDDSEAELKPSRSVSKAEEMLADPEAYFAKARKRDLLDGYEPEDDDSEEWKREGTQSVTINRDDLMCVPVDPAAEYKRPRNLKETSDPVHSDAENESPLFKPGDWVRSKDGAVSSVGRVSFCGTYWSTVEWSEAQGVPYQVQTRSLEPWQPIHGERVTGETRDGELVTGEFQRTSKESGEAAVYSRLSIRFVSADSLRPAEGGEQ